MYIFYSAVVFFCLGKGLVVFLIKIRALEILSAVVYKVDKIK
jgi:hypothetical protein